MLNRLTLIALAIISFCCLTQTVSLEQNHGLDLDENVKEMAPKCSSILKQNGKLSFIKNDLNVFYILKQI